MRFLPVVTTGLAVLLGGIACGGGSGDTGPPDDHLTTVLVDNNVFQGATVTIPVGDTVIWSWKAGSTDHNIISNGAAFASRGTAVALTTDGTSGVDYFSAPSSYKVAFPTAGTFRYYCSLHGTVGTPNIGMAGTVVVE